MYKKIRPWLRLIEGTGGSSGSGQGGSGEAGAQGGSAAAGKESGGDQGSGGRGAGDDPEAAKSAEKTVEKPAAKPDQDPAPKSKAKTSEPAPKEGGKADDSSKTTKLEAEVAELKEALGKITQDREKEAQEKRDNLATDVAKQFGLPVSSAHRLQGDTREEIEADAKALAKDLGYQLRDPTQGQGAGGTKTPKSLEEAIAAKIAAAGLK